MPYCLGVMLSSLRKWCVLGDGEHYHWMVVRIYSVEPQGHNLGVDGYIR